jgi:hypothetical protein
VPVRRHGGSGNPSRAPTTRSEGNGYRFVAVVATAGTCSLSAADLTARMKGGSGLTDVGTVVHGAHANFHVIQMGQG